MQTVALFRVSSAYNSLWSDRVGTLCKAVLCPDRFTRRAKHKSHFSLKRFEFFLFFSSKCVSERALKRDNAVVPLNTFSTV